MNELVKKFGRLSKKSDIFIVENMVLLTWRVRARSDLLGWLSLLKVSGVSWPV